MIANAHEHGWPEQEMEIDNVLANEMDKLTIPVVFPIFLEIHGGRHVADRSVKPDIEILVGFSRNFEAEVGGITRDVPIFQAFLDPVTHEEHREAC